MSVVLILSERLSGPKRAAILHTLGRIGEYVELSESSYAVNTGLSAAAISHELQGAVGVKQDLCVIPVQRSYRGPAPARVRQWLTREQPDSACISETRLS